MSLEVLRIPPEESGTTKRPLNDDRLSSIVAWASMPSKLRKDCEIPEDTVALAKSLGVGVRDIERWKRDPRVYEQVAKATRLYAIYLLPDALEKQAELAIEKRDTKAFRAIAQIAGVLSDGPRIEVNNTNVTNSTLELSGMPDGQLFDRAARIWAKVKQTAQSVEVEPTTNEGGE